VRARDWRWQPEQCAYPVHILGTVQAAIRNRAYETIIPIKIGYTPPKRVFRDLVVIPSEDPPRRRPNGCCVCVAERATDQLIESTERFCWVADISTRALTSRV
jgi:hypothetical protein